MTLKLQIKLITLKTLHKILSFSSDANKSKGRSNRLLWLMIKLFPRVWNIIILKKHKHTKISYLKII